MKVLIACEESRRVCIAFRERGHEAYSCDIQDCSGGHPEWHIKGDALEAIRGGTVVRGRLKFGAAKNSAPFPSMVVIFSESEKG